MDPNTEEFTINGHTVEFDPFDLDNLEQYLAERRVKREGESAIDTLRRLCDLIMDFFDALIGDGTSRDIFGERTNVKALMNGYRDFCAAVNAKLAEYTKEVSAPPPMQATNRAQRRALAKNMALNKP